jgi:hypothetical protein
LSATAAFAVQKLSAAPISAGGRQLASKQRYCVYDIAWNLVTRQPTPTLFSAPDHHLLSSRG